MTAERRFGRYRLDRLIGRGSAGEVWLAHDTTAERRVALKILSVTAATDPAYRRRFEREARIGASLNAPHLVPIHTFGEQGGRLFLDMAYIPGVDVAGRLHAGPMRVPEAVDLISQIAQALDAAHAAGLIHRDVKPANIIVHASGFAYLIDFGIAHVSNQTAITATGFTVGTLAYMAPERFSGDAVVESDVYALACVLYECLTALRPFGDTDPLQQLRSHLHEKPPQAETVNDAVPAALDAVIARGMAKKPENRYPGAGSLAAAARAAIGMPHAIPRTPPMLEPPPAPRTRSPEPPRPTKRLPAAGAPPARAVPPMGALPPDAPGNRGPARPAGLAPSPQGARPAGAARPAGSPASARALHPEAGQAPETRQPQATKHLPEAMRAPDYARPPDIKQPPLAEQSPKVKAATKIEGPVAKWIPARGAPPRPTMVATGLGDSALVEQPVRQRHSVRRPGPGLAIGIVAILAVIIVLVVLAACTALLTGGTPIRQTPTPAPTTAPHITTPPSTPTRTPAPGFTIPFLPFTFPAPPQNSQQPVPIPIPTGLLPRPFQHPTQDPQG